MTLLSHLSPDSGGLPSPADAHRRSLGIAAWNEALDAGDHPQRQRARAWSTTARGDRLLGAIFGNSPFLSGVAVAEWAFLTRLVEEGLDRPFDEILADTEKTEDRGEIRAALMQRLRIGKRRVALLTAIGDTTAETWKALMEARTGISRIQSFDAALFNCQIAGEIKHFDPARYDHFSHTWDSEPAYHFSSSFLYGLFLFAHAISPPPFKAMYHIFIRKKPA